MRQLRHADGLAPIGELDEAGRMLDSGLGQFPVEVGLVYEGSRASGRIYGRLPKQLLEKDQGRMIFIRAHDSERNMDVHATTVACSSPNT